MENPFLDNYAFGLLFAKMLVDDIPDEQMTQQPAGIKNHPAFTLGHMASAIGFAAKLLGCEPTAPAEWEKVFGTGVEPDPDRAKYPSKEELLAALAADHELVASAYAAADPNVFIREMPDEDFRQIMPTIGHGLTFMMLQHEWQHIGELCAWRQAMGLPRVVA